jgi:hypothetical protein
LGFLFYFAISLLRHALIPWHESSRRGTRNA